ncbi:MAG TPA: Ig-like domain-containing protein, partial [Pyrinomonadaceae bacterium]|nr:Ig-like domain-containing protein [Pyrinomonadaceae bacterium]
ANNAGLTTDQRAAGFNRFVNTTVDIGAFESRGFTITTTSGTPQSAVFVTAFGSPLVTTVSSAFTEPVTAGQVTFTAPGSGASATFTGGINTLAVTINGSNQASANATANNIVGGPYNVSAGGAGISGTATFSLTNTTSNQTITFNALGSKTFGDADFPVSATASSGLPVSFTASGQCTISTNTVHLTGAGSCTITAKQGGNSNFTAAPDASRTFTIAQAATTTAVSSSANPSNLTQSVSFTATVTGPAGAGTPAGAMTFKDGAVTIVCANAGGQTFNGSGVATCQTSALTGGAHTITAVYSGDTNFLTSTGTLSPNQVVNNLPLVSFSAANYSVNESAGVVHVIVTRVSDTTVPFNVG